MTHPRDLRDYERFLALHELLDAYAETGYAFTDTADEPGPALQSYARIAVQSPGRLHMLISEINDLIRLGLFSADIADDVDLLPRIKPPAGRTVEQCLEVAKIHLERIASGSPFAQTAHPQNPWEWRKRFPELHQLLGSYFHQDFSLDYASHKGALDDYLAGSAEEALKQAAMEIHTLLSIIETDRDLSVAADALGLEVVPPKNVTLRQWLSDIRSIIIHRLRGSPERTQSR
ncbi:contact-dependent growth inhibition system immunity protein [Streptomyces xantholiticus]|uniref:Contact-dependent growth inhibition system immunity protein n=1 Tax=Streptomyces xantholiticus TaxID=68285 RepID=A0ABV1UX02_9ACTN